MSEMTLIEDSPILGHYYRILLGGSEAYDAAELVNLLTDDFVFDGPIAGRMEGGARFGQGVRGFIETVQGVTMLQVVLGTDSAAVLYDADLPNGTVRFAEFFEFEGDRIRELRIHYNAPAYIAAGGR